MFARAETRLAFLVHSRSICVMTHSCLSVCGQSVSTLFLPPSFLAEVAWALSLSLTHTETFFSYFPPTLLLFTLSSKNIVFLCCSHAVIALLITVVDIIISLDTVLIILLVKDILQFVLTSLILWNYFDYSVIHAGMFTHAKHSKCCILFKHTHTHRHICTPGTESREECGLAWLM